MSTGMQARDSSGHSVSLLNDGTAEYGLSRCGNVSLCMGLESQGKKVEHRLPQVMGVDVRTHTAQATLKLLEAQLRQATKMQIRSAMESRL